MAVPSVAVPVENEAPQVENEPRPDAIASALSSVLKSWSVGRDVRVLRRTLFAILAELEEV